MSKLSVAQIRSGEGWILTRFSNLGAEVLADGMSDLLVGPLLVSSEAFETWTPPGGEQLEANLFAFSGDAARAMLRDTSRWGADRGYFACLRKLPDDDARRRWIPDALRPWDPERLGATAYGQVGRRHPIQGIWFARERDRARYVETAVSKVLAAAGLRLPNGDVTLVLEMPTDSTFEGVYKCTGSGESFSMKREFPSRMLTRRWFVRRGEWEAEEKKSARRSETSFRERVIRATATTGIFLMSLPVFALVALVALVTKLTGSSTSVSKSAPPRALR